MQKHSSLVTRLGQERRTAISRRLGIITPRPLSRQPQRSDAIEAGRACRRKPQISHRLPKVIFILSSLGFQSLCLFNPRLNSPVPLRGSRPMPINAKSKLDVIVARVGSVTRAQPSPRPDFGCAAMKGRGPRRRDVCARSQASYSRQGGLAGRARRSGRFCISYELWTGAAVSGIASITEAHHPLLQGHDPPPLAVLAIAEAALCSTRRHLYERSPSVPA